MILYRKFKVATDGRVDRVLETPGLPEDGEEALWGTLDALTGACHPDCQYKDPPQKSLPIES
jgi:hypothetical protein